MTDIEFFDLCQLLKFDQISEIIIRKYEDLNVSEFGHEWQLFDFEIG